MDPDVTLAAIRHTITDFRKGREDLDLGEFIDLVEALDQWIMTGGYIPAAWLKSR